MVVATDARERRLVLIPSYDTGPLLLHTVEGALEQWPIVWVVIDGSTDGSAHLLDPLLDPASARHAPGLRVMTSPRNEGKGAALYRGLVEAQLAGYTHALTMDADGQHPASHIRPFMEASSRHPFAMILGRPVFDASAPALRVNGRKISNWWADLETFGVGVADSLYGFRVYPIAPLVALMTGRQSMRRMDFDVEAVVRMCWHGVQPINLDAPVRYISREEGGVSHFRYVRDNVLLTRMHWRLLGGFIVRWLGRELRRVS